MLAFPALLLSPLPRLTTPSVSLTQAPTLPFAPPLPSPLLLPYLSLSQITHLHLLLPIHTPPHDPPLPYTRLLNSGSSTLNLDTLTLTSSLNIAMNTQNTVWSYLRAKHLILYLLPAEEEESAEAGPGGCYLRKVDPPLVSLGLEQVTTIVVIDLARATPVPWRLERLFGRPSSARASANGAVPTIRFIFHTRDGRGGFGRKVLSDFLAQMQTLDALPGTASWGGRTVLDVGSEAEADEVRLWAEGQEEAKGKSVVTDLRVVVRESKVGWAGGLKSGAWGKKKPKVESIRSVSRVGSFVGSFR